MSAVLGVLIGLVYANIIEWLTHKYILHGLGRRRESHWSFHWHEHHGFVRRHEHRDESYLLPWWRSEKRAKEVKGLALGALVHTPLILWAPSFVLTLWASAVVYYVVHKRSHLDVEWARRWLPWHYDHHMGPDQDANWCVTWPLADHLFGTRQPYLGTPRYHNDVARRARRQARTA